MNKLKHIEIETTNMCNLACSICPSRLMTRERGVMSWNTLQKIMGGLPRDNIRRSSYLHMIGEPLLHPDLINMIDFVSGHNFFTSISTNAMLLNNKMTEKLLKSKINEVTLALDSLNKETYEKIRVNGNFKRVKQNIDNFLSVWYTTDKHIKVELQVVINKFNKHEVNTFREVYGWLDNTKNGLLRIKEYSTFAGATTDAAPAKIAPRRFSCGKLNNSVAVLWNGDVTICCRSYDGQCKIGNIHENSLEEIWHGKKLAEYRTALKSENFDKVPLCKDC